MPTMQEVSEALRDRALPASWDKHQLLWLIRSMQENPAGYDLPRSWSYRPNWNSDNILKGLSLATWGRGCPPVRWLGLPELWDGLPCDMIRYIFLNGTMPINPFDKKTATLWLNGLAWARRTRHRDRLLWRDPVHWLWLTSPGTWNLRRHTQYMPRTLYLCRWLIATAQTKAWTKDRPVHGAAGVQASFRYVDIIDEVWDTDIPSPKASVERVFAAVIERNSAAIMEKVARENRTLAPMPAHWPPLLPGMRHIDRGGDLVLEGQTLQHCVGSYIDAAADGQCFIIGIETSAGRSTAEISPFFGVVQHKGVRNADPPEKNEALLRRWMNSGT